MRRKLKYGNSKITNSHGSFDSKWESQRYIQLILLERANEISDLKRQVKISLKVLGTEVKKYTADFTYVEDNQLIIEDAKSLPTSKSREWIITRKLLTALGYTVRVSFKSQKPITYISKNNKQIILK